MRYIELLNCLLFFVVVLALDVRHAETYGPTSEPLVSLCRFLGRVLFKNYKLPGIVRVPAEIFQAGDKHREQTYL
jgi:hypothetical protein